MAITQELVRLGQAARRLNDGSDQLNRVIAKIDSLLGRLMIGMDYTHPHPISEWATVDTDGKRTIEVAFVAYLKIRGSYHLAVKTVKVMESKRALATESPGSVQPLLEAPRKLRYGAVDVLPDLVGGLAQQVDDIVNQMERRCQVANSLLAHLERMVDDQGPADPRIASRFEDIAQASTSGTFVRPRSKTRIQGSGS